MSSFESLIFYISLFSISSMIIAHVGHIYNTYDNKENKIKLKIIIYTIIGIGIPIFIASIRYNVGTDYVSYIEIYNRVKYYTIIDIINSNKEILFIIITKFLGLFSNYQIMFAIISALTIYIVYKAILDNREKKSLGIMFFLYLFLNYTNSYNIIRQSLAVAIVAYSYKYIFSRNFKNFLITILIATMFHTSAIFVLPFYLVNVNS